MNFYYLPMSRVLIETFRSGAKTTVPGRLASDNTLYEVLSSGAWLRRGPERETKKVRRARRRNFTIPISNLAPDAE